MPGVTISAFHQKITLASPQAMPFQTNIKMKLHGRWVELFGAAVECHLDTYILYQSAWVCVLFWLSADVHWGGGQQIMAWIVGVLSPI